MGRSLVVGILMDLKGFDDEGADYYRPQVDGENLALGDTGLASHHEAAVVFPDRRLRITEEMIGSTVRLPRECEALARPFGIPPELDPDGDEGRHAVENPVTEGPAWKAPRINSQARLKPRAVCSLSLAHNAARVFA